MYEIKILPNRHLTTLLFCKHALRLSLECEIGTAVEPFREKNTVLSAYSGHLRICVKFKNVGWTKLKFYLSPYGNGAKGTW